MDKYGQVDERFEEKYNKMKAGIDYNNMDFSSERKFSKVANNVAKVLLFLLSALGMFIIIFIILAVITTWHQM